QRPRHLPDNPKAGIAGFAGLAGELLDLREHVQRLEPVRERLLAEREPALAPLCADVDARGHERIENALSAVVDDADTKLATIEAGADVRDGVRHFLVAIFVERADVVGRTDLLDCCTNSFETIGEMHGVLSVRSSCARIQK